jgi:hypothetical protein
MTQLRKRKTRKAEKLSCRDKGAQKDRKQDERNKYEEVM